MVWLPVLGIFNVLTDVEVCCYTQGLYRHCKRAFTGTFLGEKEHHTWDSNPCQYCAWLFSQTLYQLSYSLPQISSWGQSSHVLHFSCVQVIPEWPCVSCCQILHCFIFLSFQICPGESEMCDWRLCIAGGHVCRRWQTDSMLLFCCKPTQVTVFTDQNLAVVIGNWLKI